MKISRYFKLSEFTKSDFALRHGIDNQPGPVEIEALKLLALEILEPVRRHFGIPFSPSSGYRCPELNKLIGSKATSQHSKGQAVDFEVMHIPNRNLADWIKKFCNFDQLILEFHDPDVLDSGWVHVSHVAEGNRQQCLIFDGKEYKEF